MKKGPYDVLSSKVVYKNPWIEVREDAVKRPDQQDGIFGTIDYGFGVSTVALNDKQEIYLIKEYYYVLEEYGIQVPSGGIDGTESPLEAAQRELLEEAGVTASKWKPLGYIDPLTMIIKCPAYLFLATNITEDKQTDDTTELVKIPFMDAYQMVIESKITHAPSCIAILKTKILLDSNQLD